MKCAHCGEELGEGDDYDLYKRHINSCNSKIARDYRNAKDEEDFDD